MTVHAVVNGELYDHERISQELIEKTGYKFKSRSDSEIVVALYKHYGLSFLSRLRGEFALCLYDSRTQLFVAARDRYGIKPLFWTVLDGQLLVAAEAKAFLPLGWKPEWDVKSLLDGGWNHNERTIFRNVKKVMRMQSSLSDQLLTKTNRFDPVIILHVLLLFRWNSESIGT